MRTEGRTDRRMNMAKLTVAFRSIANEPKKYTFSSSEMAYGPSNDRTIQETINIKK